MSAHGGLDRDRIRHLYGGELDRFRDAHPASLALLERARAHMPNGTPMTWMASDNDVPIYIDRGEGAGFTDVDGSTYVDFNASDLAMFCGHANPAVIRAVTERVARSTQFLLPTSEAIDVAEELARRYPVPAWQFTLSASQANTEAIRVARAATGREVVLLFEGHYHGHFEEGLVGLEDGQPTPLQRGLSKDLNGRVRIAQFNDVDSLERALAPGDVAITLTEPALTNYVHFLPPAEGWHEALRRLTRDHGTVLAFDETHTHIVGPGGATGLWELAPDVVTIGKAVAGGIPLGAYGVSEALAAELDFRREVATGGTLFGNPLSLAAAKATLTEVLTSEAYARTTTLGARLADGIEATIRAHGLPWTTYRFGPRAGQWYGPAPATGADALALTDPGLTRLLRIWLANRGIWEAIAGAGPTVPVPATETDVDHYLEGYASLLAELTR
jgi:glutamate-1-semialdehyde 2,1-aminomutase